MLVQDLIHVYTNKDGDAVIAIGILDDVSEQVELEKIVIPYDDIMAVSNALRSIHLRDELDSNI